MKLTKAMRETMTEMMVEKYYPRANLDELRNALESFTKMQAFSSIPDSVLKTFKEYPGYFETSNDVMFAGTDGRFYGREGCIMVDFSGEHLPCPMSHFELPRNDTAVEMKKQIDEYAEKIDSLNSKILLVLSSCSTSKQVAEVFPEAVEFLPSESCTALVPIEAYYQLRLELKSLSF